MRRAATAALLLCALLAAACDPPARQAPTTPVVTGPAAPTGSPGPSGGGTFRWAIGEPRGIIPPAVDVDDGLAVVDALFDGLTTTDAAGHPVPAAATSWTVDAVATSWTFALRPGAVFADGSPVTAEAFVTAWSALAAGGPMAHLVRDVVGYDAVVRGDVKRLAGVRAVDDTTLAITLTSPRGDLPILLSHPALGPVQPQAYLADPEAYAEQPIGNGPFRMEEPWAHEDFIRATRWDGWYGAGGDGPSEGASEEVPSGVQVGGAGPLDRGPIDEVLFRIADIDTGFLAFRQGRRDLAAVPAEALPLAAEEYGEAVDPYAGPGLILGATPEVYLLVVDRDVPPYDDPLVREAVSLAVDRQEIATTNVGGNLDPAASLLPPAISPPSAGMCELCTFNPLGAATRLAEAGVTSLTFAFNAGGGHERIRDILRADLSDIGVALVSNRRGPAPTFEAYLARLATGEVGMFRVALSADVPSGLELLHPLLHSSSTPARGGLNYTGYDSPVVDALLEQAARTVDVDQREELLRRVEDIVVNRDHVVIPVVTYRHALVAAEDVEGLRVDALGRVDLQALRLGAPG